MLNQFSRTEMLLGSEALSLLKASHIAVFGLGGVGGHAAEALVRSGIGKITVVDKDIVSITNINRQIIATHETVGLPKAEVIKKRLLSINPEAVVIARQIFFLPESAAEFDFTDYDYVVDAVDTVTAKTELVLRAKAAGVPVISCMGTGNKLNPSQLEVADISHTSVCPLAKVIRQALRKRGIQDLKVVYSREAPLKPSSAAAAECLQDAAGKRSVPGSAAFTPAVAGLLMAAEVVKDLLQTRSPSGKLHVKKAP